VCLSAEFLMMQSVTVWYIGDWKVNCYIINSNVYIVIVVLLVYSCVCVCVCVCAGWILWCRIF
jgi:hypothetical protein